MTCWAMVGVGRSSDGRRRIFKPLVTLTTELLTERADKPLRWYRAIHYEFTIQDETQLFSIQ